MINHRFIFGSILSAAAAAMGCAHSSSQAPTPSQSGASTPTQTGARTPTQTGISAPLTGPALAATSGCPGGNGIHISATAGTPTDSSAGVNQLIGLGQSVDTTWVFNITRRTWTRTNLAAAISVGLADETRGRYAICAGVTALMPSATLTLQGARGRVHFAASLKDLSDALRSGPGR